MRGSERSIAIPEGDAWSRHSVVKNDTDFPLLSEHGRLRNEHPWSGEEAACMQQAHPVPIGQQRVFGPETGAIRAYPEHQIHAEMKSV